MKKYKIGNRIVEAKSVMDAIKINNIIDSLPTYSLQQLKEMRVGSYRNADGNETDVYKVEGKYCTNPNTSSKRFDTLGEVVAYVKNNCKDSCQAKDSKFYVSSHSEAGFNNMLSYLHQTSVYYTVLSYKARTLKIESLLDDKLSDIRHEFMKPKYDYAMIGNITDSCKDEASEDTTISALIADEHAAIDAYRVAIENLKGRVSDKAIAILEHILEEEEEHVKELQSIEEDDEEEVDIDDMPVGQTIKTETRNINIYGSAHKNRLQLLKEDVKLYNSEIHKSDKDENVALKILKRIQSTVEQLKDDYEQDITDSKNNKTSVSIEEIKSHYRQNVDNVLDTLPTSVAVYKIVR